MYGQCVGQGGFMIVFFQDWDFDVCLVDDFFCYVNGLWLLIMIIFNDQVSIGLFWVLCDNFEVVVYDIFEELIFGDVYELW